MPSTRGRQVVIPLTNRSGGSVAAGDVVVIDTTASESFTTTTTGRAELSVGVAQETIANLATGRVLVAGYAALVNVPASVTRGHYIETHTVVKQATGSATRRSGSLGQFLSTSATPTAWLWGQTDQTASGSGQELDYVEFTANVSVTATTAATANTVVTGSAVTYDGSTIVRIEFYCVAAQAGTPDISFSVWDGATDLGRIAYVNPAATYNQIRASRRLTPSNGSHTYSIRSYVSGGTGTAIASTGGAGTNMPGYIRIARV